MNTIKEHILFFVTLIILLIIFTVYIYIFLQQNNVQSSNTLRIASLSPSITEYIYDIGLGDSLIANTTYCNYPEEAKYKEKIGSFNNINYEHIAKLKINTAVIQQDMEQQKKRLQSMGIHVIEIKNNTINNILLSYDILGKEFNIKHITDKRKKQIKEKIEKIKKAVPHNKNHTAVISVFRNYKSEISTLTAAGGNNIYNDILTLLNITNPLSNLPPYTEISKESLLKINPDFIFDMCHGENSANVIDDWQNIPLKALKHHNIIILTDTYLSLPGPRIDMIIEKFANEYYGKVYD